MYKDKNGSLLSLGCVVVTERGHFYSVKEFDPSRNNKVILENGCVFSCAKPEDLLCIDSVEDFYTKW